LLVLSADHLISDQSAFDAAVGQALELVRQNFLVTFGVKPTRPETGYGYIEAEGHRVLRFVEKPDMEKAKEYLATGGFFWNAGIFCFKARVILSELAAYAPDLLAGVEKCLTASDIGPVGTLELEAGGFAEVADLSIDYAVMEKSQRVAVVPCDIGWSDIGSWNVLADLYPADAQGNHVFGDAETILEDVRNCDICGEDRLVAALGVENLLVVDTPDALLVADKSKAQEVKQVYNRLKDEGHTAYKHHRTVYRYWGAYTRLETGPRFSIERVEIKPGASLSMRMHHHRSEHWIVVSGMAEVTRDDEVFLVDTNESIYIKAGHKHRVANRGLIDLVLIEVQSGDYLGEDDIVRFDDSDPVPAAEAKPEKRGAA
jgi:mannose-1-phosphate guanylyltransferase